MTLGRTKMVLYVHPEDLKHMEKQDQYKNGLILPYNPAEYSINKTVGWQPQNVSGKDFQKLSFSSSSSRSLTMELFYDTWEAKTDVREQTESLLNLALIQEGIQRPPFLLLHWGSLEFECVITSIAQKFVMFLRTGEPCRATVSITLQEGNKIESGAEAGQALEWSDDEKAKIRGSAPVAEPSAADKMREQRKAGLLNSNKT